MSAPLANTISLKQGAKQRRSLFPNEKPLADLQKIDFKNIPILYIQTKTTVVQPITILYNHDANESLPQIKDWISVLAEIFKANIIVWEYPGYTKGSTYSDQKTASHIEYVWRFITKKLGQSPNRVILYGKGAGCGPTLYLAYKIQKQLKTGSDIVQERLAGIILINPQIQNSSLCFSCVTLQQVKKITTPIIFISSTACNNQVDLVKLSSSFQFTRGVHFLKSDTLDFEDERLDEMCYRLNKFIITLFPEYKDLFTGAELEKHKPVELFTDPIETVRHFLKKDNLDDLTEHLVTCGYMCYDDLMYIEKYDIDGLGLSPEIGDRLFALIEKERSAKSRKTPPVCFMVPHTPSPENGANGRPFSAELPQNEASNGFVGLDMISSEIDAFQPCCSVTSIPERERTKSECIKPTKIEKGFEIVHTKIDISDVTDLKPIHQEKNPSSLKIETFGTTEDLKPDNTENADNDHQVCISPIEVKSPQQNSKKAMRHAIRFMTNPKDVSVSTLELKIQVPDEQTLKEQCAPPPKELKRSFSQNVQTNLKPKTIAPLTFSVLSVKKNRSASVSAKAVEPQ
ncbi:hypothetical protein EIN_283420 [Entamoeba invadens IP1]|uniref:Uncharacterized protein n=1 Tax=Entamoeba invadens IP1 TaxID=370355 RepID=L7FJL1_ENTIV|nr:hypothetical protein EIN_283420 [Entamoeba invadens IP1]ELP84806.1 hypothetical protein EIN_283420 [Entamoeba invadens IP1]|eukprot:XP_004184152.1 hypothetical protein EIN_283420 [Entamoeba invadens IP1]